MAQNTCFVKLFWPIWGFAHFVKWNEFSVNILRDIDVCFIALVHLYYFVFL
jgi:hypothetical protein